MKVSVVTPSFNQGKFIKRTLESVATQTGAEIVHVVFDGGSTDDTVDLLKRFGQGVKWVSEKDKGQTDAVNKGIRATDGEIVGSAQLDLAGQPNGRHRAEVTKLMVLSSARRQGIGRLLMEAAEAEARNLGRTTLVLDTRQGDPSEALYRGMGWQPAGTIPRYARSADGTLHTTAFYYKLL